MLFGYKTTGTFMYPLCVTIFRPFSKGNYPWLLFNARSFVNLTVYEFLSSIDRIATPWLLIDIRNKNNYTLKNIAVFTAVMDQILKGMHLLLGGIGHPELSPSSNELPSLSSSSKHTPQFLVPSAFFFTWYPFSSTFVEHHGLYPVTWLKSYVHAWYVLLFKSNLKGNTHGLLKTAFLLFRKE